VGSIPGNRLGSIRGNPAVEPVIGHVNDSQLRRNRLKGALGDSLHALGCAAGYNLRWLLRWIGVFLASMLRLFTGIFGLPNQEIGMQPA